MRSFALKLIPALYLLIYFALIWTVAPASFFLLLAFAALAVAYSMNFPDRYLKFFFLVLPMVGLFQGIFKLGPLSIGMLLVFSGATGFGFRNDAMDRFTPRGLPRAIQIWVVVLMVSLLVGLIKTVHAYRTDGSLHTLAQQAGWVIFFFSLFSSGVLLLIMIRSRGSTEADFISYVKFLIYGLAFSTVFGLLQLGDFYVGGGTGLPEIPGRYAAMFTDANALGIVVGLVIPLWLAVVCYEEQRRFLIFGPFLLFLLIVSGSRSSVFVSALASGIFLYRIKSKRINRIVLIGFVIGLTCFLVLKWGFPQYESRFVAIVDQIVDLIQNLGVHPRESLREMFNMVITDRPQLWKAGWITFQHHWLMGTGLGRYLIEMPNYRAEIGRIFNDNCCNMYLHVAAEQGIIGTLGFFWLSLSLFLKGVKRQTSKTSYIISAASSSFFALMMAFVMGAHLLNAEVHLFYWLLLGIMDSTNEYS